VDLFLVTHSETRVPDAGHSRFTFYANQIPVGELKPVNDEQFWDDPGDWTLEAMAPARFAAQTIAGNDEGDAVAQAEAWLNDFFRREPKQIPNT
jgi:hypothetical protein